MNAAVFYLPCIPNIEWLKNAAECNVVLIEREENFVKSSYRNRYEIAGPNGRQTLSIPLVGGRDHHRLYKDTRIAKVGHWQRKHWQAIRSAYGSAPFFEFYAYRFEPLYQKEADFLFDFNLDLLNLVLSCLKLNVKIEFTDSYEKDVKGITDLRNDKGISGLDYYQNFAERHGFIPNLCALDLIFNEGNRSLGVFK